MKKWLKKILPSDYKQSKRFKNALSVCKLGVINVDIVIEESDYDDFGGYYLTIIGTVSSSLAYRRKVSNLAIFEATIKEGSISATGNISELFYFDSHNLDIAEKLIKEQVLPWIEEITKLEHLISYIKATFSDEVNVMENISQFDEVLRYCCDNSPLRAGREHTFL